MTVNTKYLEAAKKDAERIQYVTLDEINRLGNMLARLCKAHCKMHGCYAAVVGGVKTLYILK